MLYRSFPWLEASASVAETKLTNWPRLAPSDNEHRKEFCVNFGGLSFISKTGIERLINAYFFILIINNYYLSQGDIMDCLSSLGYWNDSDKSK